MAASGFTPISLYYSTTASAVPTAGNLVDGELALNITDGKLYYKDNGGVVRLLADRASTTPVTTLSFGTTGLTPSTATSGAITVAGTLVAANGGTGQSSYTTGDLLVASSSTALSRLADVATGNALISGGVGVAPFWGKIGLTTHVNGTLPIANGGTGATSAANARSNLGATTVGGNLFTLTNPSAITFLRVNADNTVSALDAATFRTAIGAGTGSGTVTGVTATSPVASSGGTAPVISLSSAYGDTLNPYGSKTANFFLAAPNGAAGVPTFRAIVAADIPTLNQNTTGTAANVTGTVAIANGGTGATTASGARTNLGASTLGANIFTLTNPSAITFPRFNADNTISALDAATFRTAIGAGTGSGSVTSVSGTGTVNGITLTGTVTSSGSLTLGGTLSGVSLTTQVSGTLPIANGGTGQTTASAAFNALSPITSTGDLIIGNGTNSATRLAIGTSGQVLTSNGTTAVWSAPGASLLGQTDSASPFETALGFQAGNANTGTENTFIGYQSGAANTTGTQNTAVGYQSFNSNTTGIENTAFGRAVLLSNTTGGQNAAFGRGAMYFNTTGGSNSAFGMNALQSNTTGGNNTAVGRNSLFANTIGVDNTAVGVNALDANTTGSINIAVGNDALGSNTAGSSNTVVGYFAMGSNTSGGNNVALGRAALAGNTTGGNNIAIGYEAARFTDASNGVAIGYQALLNNTTGTNNVAIGYQSLYNTTGSNNTAVGYNSGNAITSGTKNSILGSYTGNQGGLDIRSLSNYIVLSDGDGNPRVWWDNNGNMRIPKAVRATITTDNDLSFDMNAASNFQCTPTAGGALTFTNITSGQTGNIILVNGANYAITAAATTKVSATCLATISATGTYWLSYYSDGTNVYVANTGALA